MLYQKTSVGLGYGSVVGRPLSRTLTVRIPLMYIQQGILVSKVCAEDKSFSSPAGFRLVA